MSTASGRARAVIVVILWLQSSIVVCCLVLLPALPLLLVPRPWALQAFGGVAARCQAAWLCMATAALRFGLGIRIILHGGPESLQIKDLLKLEGDLLLLSNHPTRVDWMFLWGLAVVIGRPDGLKIALKDSLRTAPGFGWAVQCFAFPFISRRSREADLDALRQACQLHGGRGRLALLIFAEGTDLSDSNLQKSWAYAEKNGLKRYEQVLHPKTAGLEACWSTLEELAVARNSAPPLLLDVTMAYEDYVPGELPNEVSIFAKGRRCREVHISVGSMSRPKGKEVAEVCRELFAKKEDRLQRFYAPCKSPAGCRSGGTGLPDKGALEASWTQPLEMLPGAGFRMVAGTVALVILEAIAFWMCRALGWVVAVTFIVAACSAFVLVGRATGGVDQALFQHKSRWPTGLKESLMSAPRN